jgi:asparagine synthase (glutamine-hydrolysing)
MCNWDGSIWIAFNGEIYNHEEIRKELEGQGPRRWKTSHSDTEMIIHAFEAWGIDCIQKFRGMFAIALWDGRKDELWLIRDRIGIKPLYYAVHKNRLIFASEIKAILADPEITREVDEESFFHFLGFLTSPAPNTLFKGIKKLPAAHWLRINTSGQIREQGYWDPLDHAGPLGTDSEDEIAHALLARLRESVDLRKVGDVPVGVFLSGGIDSSANAALFSEGEAQPVRTFSIAYEGEYKSYPSELKYARKMAELVGAEHHEKLLSMDDLIEFLPEMVRRQDEPLADPVCVPLYYVSKLARENGVTVCQAGEGSDELFIGYDKWKKIYRLQKLNSLPASHMAERFAMGLMRMRGETRGTAYEMLRRAVSRVPLFWTGSDGFTETVKRSILSGRLKSRFNGMTGWEAIEPIHSRFLEKAWEKSFTSWMTYMDLNLRLPELLLMRIDKMSMGVALEARVPFLDHEFVEFAMSIPERIKFKGLVQKSILKKSVTGLIPDELIHRKKQGFGVPVEEWFMERLGKRTELELKHVCKTTDLLDWQGVKMVLDHGSAKDCWTLLNFALWFREHFQ